MFFTGTDVSEKVIYHTDKKGSLAELRTEHMEELGCGERPHQCIDPHRHDEENNRDGAAVKLLIGKYPCGRIAEQYAY